MGNSPSSKLPRMEEKCYCLCTEDRGCKQCCSCNRCACCSPSFDCRLVATNQCLPHPLFHNHSPRRETIMHCCPTEAASSPSCNRNKFLACRDDGQIMLCSKPQRSAYSCTTSGRSPRVLPRQMNKKSCLLQHTQPLNWKCERFFPTEKCVSITMEECELKDDKAEDNNAGVYLLVKPTSKPPIGKAVSPEKSNNIEQCTIYDASEECDEGSSEAKEKDYAVYVVTNPCLDSCKYLPPPTVRNNAIDSIIDGTKVLLGPFFKNKESSSNASVNLKQPPSSDRTLRSNAAPQSSARNSFVQTDTPLPLGLNQYPLQGTNQEQLTKVQPGVSPYSTYHNPTRVPTTPANPTKAQSSAPSAYANSNPADLTLAQMCLSDSMNANSTQTKTALAQTTPPPAFPTQGQIFTEPLSPQSSHYSAAIGSPAHSLKFAKNDNEQPEPSLPIHWASQEPPYPSAFTSAGSDIKPTAIRLARSKSRTSLIPEPEDEDLSPAPDNQSPDQRGDFAGVGANISTSPPNRSLPYNTKSTGSGGGSSSGSGGSKRQTRKQSIAELQAKKNGNGSISSRG